MAGQRRCLQLPYCTRNLERFKSIVEEIVYGDKCLCFREGLATVECCGVSVVWRYVTVRDRMSGLRLRVPQPGLRVNGKTIWLKWRGSSFCLDIRDVEACYSSGSAIP